MINNQAVNATAYLMTQLRPEWDAPGCVAALRKLDLPLEAVVIGAVRYAQDHANITPAHLADFSNRAWDSGWHLPCKVHPEQSRRHTSGECASCRAERLEAHDQRERTATPPPPPLRQLYAAHRKGDA